ncbi:hypothetical protein P3T18_005952 [Paraburkholderia sp. GAS199]|uniref:hypothetical protein n=1 Tax=Paraburkholderia sp. GAS199 TaxID=3035126 RepID=UPI003D23D694
MALKQAVDGFASQSPRAPRAQSVHRDNVIPFPAARARLPVTLPHPLRDAPGAQLRALLHSPLGVYVASTKTVREGIRVELDIAPDDLDFTLHTLIATLPTALIGPLTRRAAVAKAG